MRPKIQFDILLDDEALPAKMNLEALSIPPIQDIFASLYRRNADRTAGTHRFYIGQVGFLCQIYNAYREETAKKGSSNISLGGTFTHQSARPASHCHWSSMWCDPILRELAQVLLG
jgi:hypothetical protein